MKYWSGGGYAHANTFHTHLSVSIYGQKVRKLVKKGTRFRGRGVVAWPGGVAWRGVVALRRGRGWVERSGTTCNSKTYYHSKFKISMICWSGVYFMVVMSPVYESVMWVSVMSTPLRV